MSRVLVYGHSHLSECQAAAVRALELGWTLVGITAGHHQDYIVVIMDHGVRDKQLAVPQGFN